MPIPSNLAKEQLHVAYFLAVVADAGAVAYKPEVDIRIDYIVSAARLRNESKFGPTGILFHCQLKSTTDWKIRGDCFVHAVKAEAYNKLAEMETGIRILIIFGLPKDDEKPLKINERNMQLSNCCYWYRVPCEPIPNTGSKTLKIPRDQIFDRNAVDHLLELDRIDVYRRGGNEK